MSKVIVKVLLHPLQNIFEVNLLTDNVAPQQKICMANWLPGSYKIRDFAKHIVALDAKVNNKNIYLKQLNKSTWQLPAGVEGNLELNYKICAVDNAPRGAYLDRYYGFVDMTRLLLQLVTEKSFSYEIEFIKPNDKNYKNWQMFCALKPGNKFLKYIAVDYWQAIDNPVLLGDCEVLEFPQHRIIINGAKNFAKDKLIQDVAKICTSIQNFWQDFPNISVYDFYLNVANGYGGLEHKYCSSLMCNFLDLPQTHDLKNSDNYKILLSLFSHEYFHLWNVKRLLLKDFIKPNLQKEIYTTQLWIFEGITSYYDDFMLLRSGCIDLNEYLELLSGSINKILLHPGYKQQNLLESSFNAWTKFYQPEIYSVNHVSSYYTKGAIVALLLDLYLISNTDAKVCLAHIMRELWQVYGKNEIGITDSTFLEVAERVSNLKLASFMQEVLGTVADLNLKNYLDKVGIEIQYEPWDILTSFGIKIDANNKVTAVFANSIAESSGIMVDDLLIAVNSYKFSVNYFATISPEQSSDLHLFRRDKLLNIDFIMPKMLNNKVTLVLQDNLLPVQKLYQNAWILQ